MGIWLFPTPLWLLSFMLHSSLIQHSKCENSKAIYRPSSSSSSSSTTTTTAITEIEQKQAEQQSKNNLQLRNMQFSRIDKDRYMFARQITTAPNLTVYAVNANADASSVVRSATITVRAKSIQIRCSVIVPKGQFAWRWIEYSAPIRQKPHTSMVFVCLNAVGKPRHRCTTGKALPLQPVPVCNSTTYPLSTHFCHLKATVISAFTACCPRSCMNNIYYTSTLCASRPTDAINL
ncbi:hypothetical protein T08_15201 [Trichinella sp. T8]|nr:hypothetical protein T08_15201 [Trichinella sp. T8]